MWWKLFNVVEVVQCGGVYSPEASPGPCAAIILPPNIKRPRGTDVLRPETHQN